MKHLAWLLILVFGTAIAQVPPVDVRLLPEKKCCCCDEQAGACGMPDCVPSPTRCAQSAFQLPSPVQAAAKRIAPTPQPSRQKFYAQFLSSARIVPILPVTATVTPAASVPLFKEHCRFLI